MRTLGDFFSGRITVFLFCCIVFGCTNPNTHADSKNTRKLKVLILYSAGEPTNLGYKSCVPQLSEKIDAVSCASPLDMNITMITQRIAASLKNNFLNVIVKKIEDVQSAENILLFDVILIGSATRFGLMTWETKRLFDVYMFPICIHRPERMQDKYVGCYTFCEVYPSGRDCIKSIYRALYDFRPVKLPNLIITQEMKPNEIDGHVIDFSNRIINRLND